MKTWSFAFGTGGTFMIWIRQIVHPNQYSEEKSARLTPNFMFLLDLCSYEEEEEQSLKLALGQLWV